MRARRSLFLVLLLAACGSRTGLLTEEGTFTPLLDASTLDVRTDARRDSGTDADLPPIDARPREDVDQSDCPDASTTFIYTVTTQNELLAFNPPAGSFKSIGTLVCPAGGATPFSMAVDRRGVAYVLYNDGNLFKVSTLTGACIPTGFRPFQQNYQLFGMGFASNSGGAAETLFVMGDEQGGARRGLARIDTSSFLLTHIGDNTPERAELTGTGDGRLFAFYSKNNGNSTWIGEVNKTNGSIAAENPLTTDQGSGWAFGFWGGDFYLFTGPGGSSVVTRYRPSDGSEVQVATYPSLIVGAGVSTCAPSE
ncbi:MAG: hypothetical protein HOO96_27565 [Polyangiaceae bacterium]|jgi:hypothetical protein|nr:hypothetical protein [Polyangiaceae bacterium]